jgi:hypothetical protein
VLIVAALPGPVGVDRGNEVATLLNATAASIDLSGWGPMGAAGGRKDLTGTVAGGRGRAGHSDGALQLGNQGDTVVLVDPSGGSIDQVICKAEVRAGRTTCFGR